jgi:hypothetical protein
VWGPDDVPDFRATPWQLLIRARYVHELDAVLASMVVNKLEPYASREAVRTLASAAHVLGVDRPEEASAEQRMAVLDAVLEWEDWPCGTPVPGHHGPVGPRRVFDDIGDPMAGVLFAKSSELVERAGSEALRTSLGKVLADSSALRG